MKQIIVFPRGQLGAKDRERLTKQGIIAVEADDPSRIVCVFPGVPLVAADDMLVLAMQCLADTISGNSNASPASKFTVALAAKLKEMKP